MTTIVRTVCSRLAPQYVVRAERGSSVSVTELATDRVHYIKRAMNGELDYGGLVPSNTLAKFLRANWPELDAATKTTALA